MYYQFSEDPSSSSFNYNSNNILHSHISPPVVNAYAYQNPLPSVSTNFTPNTNYDLSLPKFENRTPDEIWIDAWLKGRKIAAASTSSLKTGNKSSGHIPINVARKTLVRCLSILHKLCCAQEYLQANFESMSSAEWKKKTIEIGTLKDEFTLAVSKFESKNTIALLKVAIEQRKKKRKRLKQRKLLLKEQRRYEADELKKCHKETDMWLNSMKDKVERAKMEEHFKREADCILSEVTKKKNDAKRQLSLIQSLIKLRQVREQAAIHRGERISLEDSRAFEKVTSKSINMWENVLNDYLKEEQGLRLMLEQNAIEDTKAAKKAKENTIIKEWLNVLFGSRNVPPADNQMYCALTAAERDMETFIAIRRSWDTFVIPHDDELGSNIPIGWILPEPNAEKWSEYLIHRK